MLTISSFCLSCVIDPLLPGEFDKFEEETFCCFFLLVGGEREDGDDPEWKFIGTAVSDEDRSGGVHDLLSTLLLS